jgi:transposase
VQARNAALNQLSALLVTAPEHLRERLGALSGERLAQAAARLRPHPDVMNGVLRRLGKRVERLSKELAEAGGHSLRSSPRSHPICSRSAVWDRSAAPSCSSRAATPAGEASFAALAGTSPVDASSGKQRRHRLNRGGDRQLNWALHVVALQRIRHHPETAAYYQRLLAAGKTTREARRCVKRALARHFYRRLLEMPRLLLTT